MMTRNIRAYYSIGFKLNAGLIYSIASCYIHLLIILAISSFIQMDLCRISGGQIACPLLTQAYVAVGFFAVICQNGYLIITGVLQRTPNSRKRIFPPARVRRKFSYRSAARCQPSSSTNLSSLRKFIISGLPQCGQTGKSSVGIFISFCCLSISRTISSLSKVFR